MFVSFRFDSCFLAAYVGEWTRTVGWFADNVISIPGSRAIMLNCKIRCGYKSVALYLSQPILMLD